MLGVNPHGLFCASQAGNETLSSLRLNCSERFWIQARQNKKAGGKEMRPLHIPSFMLSVVSSVDAGTTNVGLL